MRYTLKLLLLLFPVLSFGQTAVFEWETGLTSYKGTYDTTRFSPEEMSTIYNYLHTPSSEMFTVGSVWKIEQMDSASTAPIENYMVENMLVYQNMRIPEGEFWDSLLFLRIRELYEVGESKKLFVLALKDPSVLYTHPHDSCLEEIRTLNGDSTALLEGWKALVEVQKAQNCCPEEVEARYRHKLASADRMKHARLELMLYGWHNCMNAFIYHHNDYDQVEEEFQKLFLSIERFDEEEWEE
jgi:hypothetical protein